MNRRSEMARVPLTLTFVVAGLASGCALSGQGAPPLTGPSELDLSLRLTAAPDVLMQDGIARAHVSVAALDSGNRPVPQLELLVQVAGDDEAVDSGRLSDRRIRTDTRGRAGFTYIAPRARITATNADRTISLIVTPVGTDFANAVPRSVQIRLVSPGAAP
jgi:hypothetical protein